MALPFPLTIAEASRRIASRELSPVELVEHCLRRIDRLDGTLHAFVTLTAERAMDVARAAEKEIVQSGPRGPLHGIPIAYKDIIDTAGVRTTGHSRVLVDRVPDRDANVVTRLAAAGAISLGKLATHEFALGGPSFDLPWPPARNPWDPSRFTGGSSSGTGAAVAAGLVLGGLGSDTGGSIRGPSALCGIAGLKPTFGRVGRGGVLPLAWSMDHVGPMARTAEDCALLLQAMAGPDPRDADAVDRPVPDYTGALSRGVRGLRVGVVRPFFERDNPVSPATLAAIDEATRVLASMGAMVRPVTLPPLADWHAVGTVVMLAEAHAFHAKWLRERPNDYGEIMRDRMRLAALIPAADYLHAQSRRRELKDALDRVMRDVDILVTASQAGEAPPMEAMTKWAIIDPPSYNSAFNLAGCPAMSIPTGFGPHGLPLAMQLVARPFDEPTLLATAHAYERATGWAQRTPTLADA